VTAGAVEIVGGARHHRRRGRADCTLRVIWRPGAQPLALVVANAEGRPPCHVLLQARGYRERLNSPFVFSRNGHFFVEYDRFTGLSSEPRGLVEFPTTHPGPIGPR
jgi:type I restriction enzyme, R subunit